MSATFNMDVNSPDIPALSFYPQAAQALSARLIPEDKVCGINTWPLLCYQGQDELAAYPPVHKLDEQVSGKRYRRIHLTAINLIPIPGMLRTAVLTPAVNNKDVLALINTGQPWPVYEPAKDLPLYRQALQPEPISNTVEEPHSGEWVPKLMVDKYDPR